MHAFASLWCAKNYECQSNLFQATFGDAGINNKMQTVKPQSTIYHLTSLPTNEWSEILSKSRRRPAFVSPL